MILENTCFSKEEGIIVFTSYEFIIFVFLCFVLYYLIPKKTQPYMLLLVSYLVYFSINSYYPIYLLVTTLTVYLAGCWIQHMNQKQEQYLREHRKDLSRDERKLYKKKSKKKMKWVLILCLLINLGILAVTKYTNFMIQNVNAWFHYFGSSTEWAFQDILVPLGISFYTFQSLGYLLDIYWKRGEAQTNIFKFALFTSFFPQLGQGPISRYHDLSKTLYKPHKFDWKNVRFGLERMLWGYFKKLVIADRISAAVTMITGDPEYYTGGFVFAGMIFYAIELYADFTGGIDITIGIAQVFGITITENFERPFFSKNIAEYWRRWHITMGTWFRDYIFYPLSISRPFKSMTTFMKKHFGMEMAKRSAIYVATIVVWVTTGIWHGANWRYVAWGLCNGVVILVSEELSPLYQRFHKCFPRLVNTWGYRAFQIMRTFLLMCCLRIFDRYGSCRQAVKAFVHMFTQFDIHALTRQEFLDLGLTVIDYVIVFAGVLVMFSVSMLGRNHSVREWLAEKPYLLKYMIFVCLLFATILLGTYGVGYDVSAFIYNQF